MTELTHEQVIKHVLHDELIARLDRIIALLERLTEQLASENTEPQRTGAKPHAGAPNCAPGGR